MAGAHEVETRATGSYDDRDGLTGVRGYYMLLNEYEKHTGDDVYVMLCDVDDFRMINDAYGENVGNELLARIGKTVSMSFGDAHTFRYGSDEFLVVNEFFDEYEFMEKVDNLNRRISSIDYDGKPLRITCSFGYVHGHIESSEDLHEAVRYADRKMYEAKRLGKNRAVGSPLTGDPVLTSSLHGHHSALKSYEVDELTGMANLIYFRNALSNMLEDKSGWPQERDERPALVYFNIENFKGYNQHYGFDAGDELLLHVADAISKAFPGDLAARFSADQFAVITRYRKVVDGITKVRKAFRRRQKASSIWLRSGFYAMENDDDDAGVVNDRAKLACDTLKGRRDAFYREYDEELRRAIVQRRYVLDNFNTAVREGWIRAFYQPIVRVASGEICDVEALARWIDPAEGVISPVDFVPALEDARLIHRLDLQVLRSVCEDCARLRAAGREFIYPSINLSRLDFELCDIVSEVMAVLDEYEIGYDMISVEVTESALVGNQDFLKDEVDRFRAAGFEVWMDDFGSGYSSLNVLKDYKFDLVKIDMDFLRGLEDVREARIMLAHVVNLAKELGFQTLVEGVETAEQLEFLRGIGCGRAQGFFIGKPISLDDSIADSIAGKLPQAELHRYREYYDVISSVNLLRPDPVDDIDGNYVPADAAACIIRYMDGRYTYLNVNDMYKKFLRDVGIGTVEDSEIVINDVENERRANFTQVIDRCGQTGNWESYIVTAGNVPLSCRMKKIAQMPGTDAFAVLSIVEPERKEFEG